METVNHFLSGTLVPVALLISSVYFLIRLRGYPMKHYFRIIRSIISTKKERNKTSIRAVFMALAGTLGVGNIVGVASAIALGGIGAVFWMWVSALLAMILKYCEVLLAVSHRRSRGEEYYGGAMYYMRDYFASCRKRGIGTVFILIFVAFCLINGFTMGSMIQANSIAVSAKLIFDAEGGFVGGILAVLSIIVFLFNGKRIFSLCEKLVPTVSIIYISMSLIVIIMNYERLPMILRDIFYSAFSFKSVWGGTGAYAFMRAIRYGTIRGLFSNEAGCGTSPIAHATAKTDSSVEQGFLGIVEVFIDTIVVCSMTAFVIIINGDIAFLHSDEPLMMVFASFRESLGDVSGVMLAICIFLFAFATVICWGYYGRECIYYFNRSKIAEKTYYVIYILCIYIGSCISLEMVWQWADLAVGVMTLMNLYILYKMRNEIYGQTAQYYKKSSRKESS